ncbi:MAG: acyl carrier protein [Planctomycetes bacterium]|nr:acyl carrier protein [Planctomycetota bacterium]
MTVVEDQNGEVDIKMEIRKFISNNFVLPDGLDGLKDNDSFLENGIIDSTGVVELVTFVEETFDIIVEDEELIPDNLDSVSSLVVFITEKRHV